MLVNNSFRFTDLSNIQDRIIDIGIGVLISEAIHQIRKYHLLSRKYDFRKKFGWFQIGCLAVSFIALAMLSNGFEKIHMKPIGRLVGKPLLGIFKLGLNIFVKIEPKVAYAIFKEIDDFLTKYKVSKITGVANYS